MDDGLWASGDFDAWRWRMAALTEKLLAFPALNSNQAPSVLVGDTTTSGICSYQVPS